MNHGDRSSRRGGGGSGRDSGRNSVLVENIDKTTILSHLDKDEGHDEEYESMSKSSRSGQNSKDSSNNTTQNNTASNSKTNSALNSNKNTANNSPTKNASSNKHTLHTQHIQHTPHTKHTPPIAAFSASNSPDTSPASTPRNQIREILQNREKFGDHVIEENREIGGNGEIDGAKHGNGKGDGNIELTVTTEPTATTTLNHPTPGITANNGDNGNTDTTKDNTPETDGDSSDSDWELTKCERCCGIGIYCPDPCPPPFLKEENLKRELMGHESFNMNTNDEYRIKYGLQSEHMRRMNPIDWIVKSANLPPVRTCNIVYVLVMLYAYFCNIVYVLVR